METDRKGSKTNLNESTMPLLEDQEIKQNQEEKEKIELAETRSGDSQEKDDSAPEKEVKQDDEEEIQKEETEENSNSTEKKTKEKKPKKEKTHRRTFTYADNLTVGLNLLDRDEKHVNDQVNLVFEDVIAEPDASHGVDGVWKGAFVLFSGTKQWVYKILAALVSFPLALIWGLLFAIITLLNIWVITPVLRVLESVFYFVRKVLSIVIGATLDPLFSSCSLLCSNCRVTKETTRRVQQEKSIDEV